jgi:hypothetical protein
MSLRRRPFTAVVHADDIEISLCDGNSEDERRRRKIGSLRRKAIHALKKRGRRRVDFRFPPAISIEDVRDAEEERAVASFRERLAAHGLLPDKHDDYHMMLRSRHGNYLSFRYPLFLSCTIWIGCEMPGSETRHANM